MAFVAGKPWAASSCVVQRPALGFGHALPSSVARVAVPALRLRLASVRCSAEAGESETPEVVEPRGARLESEEVAVDSPNEFGGWSAAESEEESAGSWKAGAFNFYGCRRVVTVLLLPSSLGSMP